MSWSLTERKWYRTIRPIIRVPRKMAREFSCWSVIIVDELSGSDFDFDFAEAEYGGGPGVSLDNCFETRIFVRR